MRRTIKISELEEAILKELADYRDDLAEEMRNAAKEVTKDAVQELRAASPRKSGKYAKGWAKKVQKNKKLSFEVVVHNKDKPSLTHLLENGHAKVNGGFVPGITHIKPVEERIIQDFETKVEEIIKNGT